MSYANERKLLVDVGRRLYDKGYVPGTDGNLSILVEKSTILITPSGTAKGHLHERDLVLVNIEGNLIAGDKKPSSEMLMHLFAYARRPDIKACCHAHPPYATAFSVVGKQLPANILPEVVLSVGQIALTEYAPPGTEMVPKSLEKFIKNHSAFMLKNHGVLTIGKDLEEAYHRMETVEHFAKILYIAQGSGTIGHLDDSEVKRLEKIREATIQEGGQ